MRELSCEQIEKAHEKVKVCACFKNAYEDVMTSTRHPTLKVLNLN